MIYLRALLATSLLGFVLFFNSGCSEHKAFKNMQEPEQNEDFGEVVEQPTPPPPPPPPPPGPACNPPPPPVHHIGLKIHNRPRPGKVVLDVTPIVCSSSDPASPYYRYCQTVMNDPGRVCCPVRPEGDPMRMACEEVIMGTDPADGRVGPSWYNEGAGRLQKHSDNPYLAFYFGNGRAAACSNVSPAVCKSIDITDNQEP